MSNYKNLSVYTLVVDFFKSYLTKRDVNATLKFVTDDVFCFGNGKNTIAFNKQEFQDLLTQEFLQMSNSIPFHISEYREKQIGEDSWFCVCKLETYWDISEENPFRYQIRISMNVIKKDGNYFISALHISREALASGEAGFFPLRFSSKDTKDLTQNSKQNLIEIICQMMPGGIVGGYLMEKLPLYAVNDTLLNWLGYTYEEFVVATDGYVINMLHPDDRNYVENTIRDSFADGNEYKLEYRVQKKNGTYLWVNGIGRKVYTEDDRETVISVLFDVTETVLMKKRLLKQSETDALTGLYNRRGGEERIAQALEHGEPYVFLITDIDNFKSVNDIYGHQIGDHVLQYVAQLLQTSFRSTDVKLRLGGDEFVIFVHPCEDITMVKHRLHEIGLKYMDYIQKYCPDSNSSLSFGGVYRTGYFPFSELYQAADKVLYEIKEKYKGNYKIDEI